MNGEGRIRRAATEACQDKGPALGFYAEIILSYYSRSA